MQLGDAVARTIFLICAVLLVLVILGVFYFVGANGLRLFFEKGGANPLKFFFSNNWDPLAGSSDFPQFGASGLIVGSFITTICSVIIASPLAFGVALFMVEVAPRRVVRFCQPLLEIFVGMPSVVIGFLGLVVLVPWLRELSAPLTHHRPSAGYGFAAAILVLVIMILPTITSVSIDALRAVPGSVREASLALGSTRWQMMWRAILPAATPALVTAVVLGMSRAIGETLAVSMVLAGQSLPDNLLDPQSYFQASTNVTREILQNFTESSGPARDAYWMLALTLLVISFLFICISRYFASRSVYK